MLAHGGAEFADVGDVDLLPVESHGFENLIEFAAGRADKGFALEFFVVSGGFANEHEACVRVSCGEDHGVPQAAQSLGWSPTRGSLDEIGEFFFDA